MYMYVHICMYMTQLPITEAQEEKVLVFIMVISDNFGRLFLNSIIGMGIYFYLNKYRR